MSTKTTGKKKHPAKDTAASKGLHWHVYGQDLGGIYQVLVIGPTNLGPDDINPAQKKTMREVDVAGNAWLADFDHEPTDLEKDQLQPENFRQFYADGTERPWED